MTAKVQELLCHDYVAPGKPAYAWTDRAACEAVDALIRDAYRAHYACEASPEAPTNR